MMPWRALWHWRAWRALMKYHRRHAHRLHRPWSFGESHRVLERIERNISRLVRVFLGQNPWHVHCADCGYDLHGVEFNPGGRSKNCPECNERTRMPSGVRLSMARETIQTGGRGSGRTTRMIQEAVKLASAGQGGSW